MHVYYTYRQEELFSRKCICAFVDNSCKLWYNSISFGSHDTCSVNYCVCFFLFFYKRNFQLNKQAHILFTKLIN